MRAFKLFCLGTLPVAASSFALAVLSSFAQIGPIFTFEPLTPDLGKLSPLSGLQRLVSLKQGIEALRLVLKIGVFTLALWMATRDALMASTPLWISRPHHSCICSGVGGPDFFSTWRWPPRCLRDLIFCSSSGTTGATSG